MVEDLTGLMCKAFRNNKEFPANLSGLFPVKNKQISKQTKNSSVSVLIVPENTLYDVDLKLCYPHFEELST